MGCAARPRTLAGWTCIFLTALVGVALASTPARARPGAAGGKRIAVLAPTDGTAKDVVITTKIAAALKKQKLRAVTGGAVKRATAAGLPSSDGEWVELARKLRVDGIVEPIVSSARGKRRVELVVRNGLDGSVAGRESFSAKGPPKKLAAAAAAGVWRKLGSTIRGTEPPKKDTGPTFVRAPVASEPTAADRTEEPTRETADTMLAPADEKAEPATPPTKPMVDKDAEDADGSDERGDEEPSDEGKPGGDRGRRPRVLEVELGNRVLFRAFAFTPSSAGASYNESFVLVPRARIAWFPLRHAGLFVAGEFNPSLTTGSNPAYPTYARELVLGAEARYPLSMGAIALNAGYFQHVFMLGDPSDPNSPRRRDLVWPNFAYQGLRIAASGRFRLWSFLHLGAEAAYRLTTVPGTDDVWVRSSHYFPNAKVDYGFDGAAFIGVGVLPWLEVRGGVDYRRYQLGALVPGPDNTNGTNATGAVDQYLGYTVSVVGFWGGN